MELAPLPKSPEPLLAAWIKWTMDFWESLIHMGPSPGNRAGEMESFWDSALKMWQAFFSLLSEPETVAVLFEGIKTPSETLLRMAQAGWSGYFHLHQLWVEKEVGEWAPLETRGFENLDQDIFKICTETYEKDFRQLMNLSQAGLTRLSQECVNRAMDRFRHFQAAMAEFIYLLYLPLKKSLREMQDLGPEEIDLKDFKEFYRFWLRTLEGHYMTLFKSPEYTRTMSHTLEALEDFTLAKQELLADSLALLNIPSRWEMDELCREIYELKKQLKGLAKQVEKGPLPPDRSPGGGDGGEKG